VTGQEGEREMAHVYGSRFSFHATTTEQVEVRASDGGIHHVDLKFRPHGSSVDSTVDITLALDSLDGVMNLRDALDRYIATQVLKGVA
jgi:hypothetical protein